MKKLRGRMGKTLTSIALSALVLGSGVMGAPAPTKAAEAPTKITLLGTSDIHGRFMPWDYALDGPNPSGSLTQLFTMIKEIRKENPNTVLVDAGDSIQDNSAELFNDQPESPMMVAMNEMGYDAWAFGNHEFNFGLDTLDKISSQYKGPVLAGNIYKENGERYFPAYTIVERAGVKIGLIGMNTPMITDFEKGTDHLDGLVIKNPVEETKKAVKELQGKVDVMIGVMHMGIENENGIPGTGVADIANAVPELTAIFAGHMHKLVKKEEINGVLITEPDKYGTHLSRIDLTFEKKNGKVVLASKEATALPVKGADGTPVVSDPELETKLTPFHEFARADANIVVAELKGMNLVPKNEIEGIPQVQIQETPLSDFFHEVMLYYSKADVVAHQIDNDKAKLDVGPIKKKDIAYNYQYAGGEITVYKVTGKDLKDYMEWAVGYFNTTRPGDVTVSFDSKRRASKYSTNDFFGNVKYEIDLSKPYGSRITNLRKLDGTLIKAEDTLKLGMNAYRMEALQAKGGALEGRKFEQLWSSKDNTTFGETAGTIRNRAIAYLKEVKKGVYEPKVQNNWKIIGVDTTAPERNDVVELINAGILSVPKTEDGKYSNIASINIKDAVTKEEIAALSEKAKVDAAKFANVKTKGEFYKQLNQARKAAAAATPKP
ncbi:2',3'-cyclic-nucleotide 2'-phosphodiesterase [Brevibacillus reuszeri]|uniref:2', 3'-cyclic nucleotide 2'-phosphodiesterase n=1 Tax=Brevibacillus reuszeri TaxID=54915 RepID=A0A0K9YSM0_9BACL|nr:5'-nucleotidase C-terminal domain-containing protein [Brevibacillus reuszeri]KNB71642.1 2', 3'-cyclic nucleotide 2'-phosphodiesterase [Brevibacillus reuszeri]MED1855538.1 5'-nucleotidase C-terminal domain-containing protein [Brevibacillus reuszeri]GED67312.1 2',3'-cyclic-nucleotide 2'-phosphodiesterase [Brevibacillus reuszeri]